MQRVGFVAIRLLAQIFRFLLQSPLRQPGGYAPGVFGDFSLRQPVLGYLTQTHLQVGYREGCGLNAKRGPTSTGFRRIGVGKNKAFAVETTLVVQSHSDKIKKALGVDDNFCA